MRDSAIIYESFYKGVQQLPKDQQADAYNAYCELTIYGKEYDGENLAISALLASLSPKIEEANRKYAEKSERMIRNRVKSQDITRKQQISQEITTVTVTDTVSEEKPSPNGDVKEKAPKHKHGRNAHVLLTDQELETLVTDFGEEQAQAAIDYLDEYIERKGYKAKSHYLAIRKWVFDAMREDDLKKAELEQRENRLKGKPPDKHPEKRGKERVVDYDALFTGG